MSGMLTAVSSGTVVYDGESVEIVAGRTRVRLGHEIAKTAPHLFGLSEEREQWARSRSVMDRLEGTPSWYLGPSPLSSDEEYLLRRMARHEGAHAAAAHILGWKVTRIHINPRSGGETKFLPPSGMAGAEKTCELAVIAAAAEKHVGWSSTPDYANDRRLVAKARELAPNQSAAAAYTRDLDWYVGELVKTSRFRGLARQVADALLESGGRLEGDPLRSALRYRR